jgi:ATP/maltotriose-dependent transcriptional regulator MalT
MGHALNFLGFTAFHQSDYVHATLHFEAALSLYREVEGRPESGVGFTLSMLARIAISQAQYERAGRLGQESLAIGRQLRHTHLTAAALDVVGRAYYCEGDFKRAQRVLGESLALSKELGHQQDVADTLNQLGLVAYYQGEYRQAIYMVEAALAVSQTLKHRTGHAKALSTQAEIALAQGDPARARAILLESLTLFQQLGMKLPIVRSLEIMGTIEAGEHQAACAVRLLAAAEALREALGAPLPPPDRPTYARALAAAREQLGKRAFATAWDEGRALSLDQAVDLALAAPAQRLSARQVARQQFGGLSKRERQVAGLLAQGKTNRQMADELVVELSTVEGHVTNILAKLGFSSRAQVAVWAVAKGIGRPPPE